MRILLFTLILTSLLYPKDLLWQLSSETARVYITGSIHMGSEKLYPLPESIEKAFSECNNLILEVNIDSLDNPQNAMKLASFMVIKDTLKLNDLISEQLYDKLSKELNSYGIPELMYQNMTPFAAGMTLTQYRLMKEGFNNQSGIDRYFFNKAKQTNKSVLELESFAQQLEVFKEMDQYGEAFIEYSMMSSDETIAMFDEIVVAWKNADLVQLDKILNQDSDGDKDLAKILKLLLDDRNVNMNKKIEDLLTTNDTYFVVVGAGHLSGKTGIINYFNQNYSNKKNYTFKQL